MTVLAWVGAVLFVVVAGALLFPGIVLDPWFRRLLHPPARTPRALPERMARRAEDVTIPGGREALKAWLVWPETGAGAEAESGAEAGVGARAGVGAGTRPGASAGAGVGSEANVSAGTVVGAEAGVAAGTGVGAAPATGAPRTATGIAVFIHGWSSDGGRMAPLAAHVLDAGVACLLVDLPGHGRTGRTQTYNAKLMVEDLGAVRGWIARREDLAALRSAILGYSFGGVGAIVAAVRDRRWDALVVMAAPVGPIQAIEIYLEGKRLPGRLLRGALYRTARRVIGVDPEVYAGTRNLPELRVPALFVHGGRDEVVPCQHAAWLHASAPRGLAELAIVDGAGHDGLLVDGEAGRRVAGFLARVLSGVSSLARGERP